jgi:phospholipid transport system substrate-binding protein
MKTGFSTLTLTCAALAVMVSSNGAFATSDLRVDSGANYIAVTAVTAQDSVAEGAKNFIASMGDRGINFLGNQTMSVEAKKAEFRNLLNESFDMSTIGRFALGTNWKAATPAQQKEYQQLFNEMIVKVYSKRFSDYKGQKFEVKSARKEGDKDFIVTSFIVPGDGPQVQVDWRVRNKNGSYRVVDIIVEGVSMSMTQRADFASVIQRGGGNVDVLLNHLRRQ